MLFFESKLSVPHYTPYLVRKRLFTYLEKHLDCSLICLISDGGYGKTTLVSSFTKERNIPTVWYKLSQIDSNPAVFLSYLKTAIMRKISGENVIYDVSDTDLSRELDKIMSILSTWPERLIIVLDDYQTIDQSPEIERMLINILSHVSPHVTFIITSRIRPNLNLVNLKLKNKLARLSTKELRFTPDEIKQYFSHLHKIDLRNQEVHFIYSKTEGWAACLQLLQDLIKDINVTERLPFWINFKGTEDIYNYLGEEILAKQSDEINYFLRRTSILYELSPEVIDKYLNIHHSEQIIDHLLTNHLFIYQNDYGEVRYHPLFQAFLTKQLTTQSETDTIQKLHSQLSTIYEEKKDFFHAFAHAISSNNFFIATQIMAKMKEFYPPSRFVEFVDWFFQEVSPRLHTASIGLFLVKCLPLSALQKVIPAMENNLKQYGNHLNPLSVSHYKHQLAAAYFYSGEIGKAEQLCAESLQESHQNKDNQMIAINLSLQSVIYFYKGSADKALEAAQKSLSYPNLNNFFHPTHISSWILAEVHLMNKKLDKAKLLLEETLKISKQRHNASIVYPYCSMGKYFRLIGDHHHALEWINKAKATAEEFQIEYAMAWVYKELSTTYMELENWDLAELYLSKAYSYVTDSAYLKCTILQLQTSLYTKRGKNEAAADTLKEFQDICTGKNYHWLLSSAPVEVERRPVLIKEKRHADRSALSITTLGNFEILANHKLVPIKRKASLHLLQYLITHQGSKINKDSILDELFPGGLMESANNQFYVALSNLRKSLEPDLKKGPSSSFIKRDGEHYYLDTEYIHLDINEFTRLAEQKNSLSPLERIQDLKQAEALYKGDYFEGYPYNIFLELDRERYRVLYINLLQELAEYYWNTGDYSTGQHYYDKLLNKEPYQESLYLDYIEKLLTAKMLLHANRVSKLYQQMIEKELGIPVVAKIEAMFSNYSKSM
ncbi:BTAD domain-containing putative transcriptional regulator [Halalkalibacter oceani]|uniref:BTAD domain-containing putative transcriptional regulator n=1 Tax=Halalkalibacter oceani TaxID=1653776 RepID=UPI0033948ADC